jgi:hypothetical protein
MPPETGFCDMNFYILKYIHFAVAGLGYKKLYLALYGYTLLRLMSWRVTHGKF